MAKLDEDAIIKLRFLTQTAVSGQGEPPFKKLTKKYIELCQHLNSRAPEERIHQCKEEFLAHLYSIQLFMKRLEAMSTAYQEEQAAFSAKQQVLETTIGEASVTIQLRKEQLESARKELQNLQEYEKLRCEIVQVPARSVIRSEMDEVQNQIDDLERQGKELDAWVMRRQEQLKMIATVIGDVHKEIAQEGELERVVVGQSEEDEPGILDEDQGMGE